MRAKMMLTVLMMILAGGHAAAQVTVNGNVYGGGNAADVGSYTEVNITHGTVSGNVYGGGFGESTVVTGSVTVNIGAKASDGTVSGDATITGDVYGGSAKGKVNATKTVSGNNVTYGLTTGNPTTQVNIYSTSNTASTGGVGNIYGGGYGKDDTTDDLFDADVYGDVTVCIGTTDEGQTPTYSGEATIRGSVYGCNNVNGTPKGNVTVKIYETAHNITNAASYRNSTEDNGAPTFAISKVFGGGNQASYNPVGTDKRATVYVYGCDNTIDDLFGGGDAAAAYGVATTVDGGRLGRVFGGGNGEVTAADIGDGGTDLKVHGGYIGQLFAGSNESGTISGTMNVEINHTSTCDEYIAEFFGGSNKADLGTTQSPVTLNTTIGCGAIFGDVYGGCNLADIIGDVTLTITGSKIGNVYAGSKGDLASLGESTHSDEAADITGKVTLNLYGGEITNAFGGSNIYGNISGKITVNVLDYQSNDCQDSPLKVNNIYGAGNWTTYSPARVNNQVISSPEVNVIHIKSGSSITGNVYGGGKGDSDHNALVTANPIVNIGYYDNMSSQIPTGYLTATGLDSEDDFIATVAGNVYGGGDVAGVTGNTTVYLRKANSSVGGSIFGGGNEAVVSGNTSVYVVNGAVTQDVYGGGALANVGTNASNTTIVTITDGAITGNIYGGGLGRNEQAEVEDDPNTTDVDESSPYVSAIPAKVNGTVTVTVDGGTVNNVFGCNNLNGSPQNTVTVNINSDITRSVYGGGNLAAYAPTTPLELTGTNTNLTVNINSGTIGDKVFGGGLSAGVTGTTSVTINDGTVTSGVYGGCNTSGTIGGAVTVTVKGGTLGSSSAIEAITDKKPETLPNILFGGGKGSGTSVTGLVTLNVGETTSDNALIYGNVYGGSEEGEVSVANVNLNGNTIQGNVFGGGYRTAEGKTSATNVTVTLDGTTFDRTYDGTAQIFGANNVQGSPTGHVLVHVKNTAPVSGQTYDIAAVYGGGNNADYNPTDETQTAEVVIEGCTTTSIENVYGGGNAAAVPGSEIWILGSKVIDNVFGGGNGVAGPDYAAHVGFHREDATTKTDYTSGEGTTYVNLVGGTIHTVYGGSNSNGDIRGGSNILMPTVEEFTASHSGMSAPVCCNTLTTTNIYGGGKNADMSGGTTVVLGCVEGLDNVYGGAMSANIKGGVNLVVTSGTFKKVFGGNDTKGTIQGPINLYIEETGCEPLVIGELYLGGNLAPYSVYGYKQGTSGLEPRQNSSDGEVATGTTAPPTSTGQYADPVLHVTSFTSIGNIFGGGLGASAKLYGNPTIEINEVVGRHADEVDGYPKDADNHDITALVGVAIPQHAKDAIGAIGNVYGGGNLATVYGSTKVNIGTETTVGFKTEPVHLRPSTAPTTPLTKNATTGLYDIPVDGVNITGNVYGGGNQADVTGDTQVNICAKETGTGDNKTWTNVTPGTAGVTIGENVFGGGKGIASDVTKAHVPATNIHIGNGAIKKSVYGGGELAQVEGNTNVTVMGGTIGTAKADLPFGVTMGAVYGNIYGGGMGNTTNSAAGLIKGNTNVTVANSTVGETTITPTILHNIYGGGAYGSVGDFTFTTGAPSARTGGGTANVTITGGTIGTDGHENGMVFGSSRGDVAKPVAPSEGADPVDPNDKLAWVYDANVIIGTSGATTGPQIKGSVYGSGENGHTYNNTDIKVYSGTIGVNSSANVTIYDLLDNTKKVYEGKAYNYANRGNVYGGGCGTDMYDSNNDGTDDMYNPLAGVVQGTTSVTITGGTVVHNVYGAGALGSVGKTTKDGNDIVISSGGTTTIEISGGIVGVDGDGNGNVFGAARGDSISTQAGIALVKTTNVIISGDAAIKGNVYGGGQAGDVGTYHTVTEEGLNKGNNNYLGGDASGVCNVVVTGGTIGTEGTTIAGHVFGAGKGAANTYTCQKAMVKETSVTISNGTIYGDVYGGGEVGRVEQNATVSIGTGTGSGTFAPVIYGNVFGAGAGLETHGYSALVRGNTTVTIQGKAKVKKNVYGGGEIAAVGKYALVTVANQNEHPGLEVGMPYALVNENLGECSVTIKGDAEIGSTDGGDVFGAGMGVDESKKTYAYTAGNTNTMPKRMMTYDTSVYKDGFENPYEVIGSTGYVWEYYPTRQKYLTFLQTLALATDTKVSIEGNAKVKGSVYGGSESGFVQRDTEVKIQGTTATNGSIIDGDIYGGGKGVSGFYDAGRVSGGVTIDVSGSTTHGSVYGGGKLGFVKGAVTVNMTGGTVDKDVYGGGALADTNTGNWADKYTKVTVETDDPVAGLFTKDGDNYTPTASDAVAVDGTDYYSYASWTDATKKSALYTTKVSLTGGKIVGDAYGGGLGNAGTPAFVHGDVLVDLNGTATKGDDGNYTGEHIAESAKGCIVSRVFGCNNINGTPKGEVVVYVHATQSADASKTTIKDNYREQRVAAEDPTGYDVQAVYGGGNQAEYWPVAAKKDGEGETEESHSHTNVIIDGCAYTSIKQVYGGGNAASTPATCVTIFGAYEINEVFGGGNGKDAINETTPNPGAHVGFHKYTEATESTTGDKANQKYGFGKAQVNIGGGTIHYVFGGSNSKGNVREVAVATLDDQSDCDFIVDEAYGGGKAAEMDGRAELNLGCIPENGRVSAVYGGAKMTNVNNDVVLNITNGTFDAVYGGNNVSGDIRGTITVNVEEKGCTPIIIGKLFGGGNRAAYSVENIPEAKRETDATKTTYYKNYPQVNVISATRIGQVFGGGDNAAVTGNPHVKIDMVKGKVNNVEQALGTICQVFGGGNNAGVTGDTYVDVTKGQITKEVKTAATETTAAVYYYDYDTGVFGGCNTQGTVTGDAHVTVSGGKIGSGTLDLTTTTKTFTRTVTGNVHGGGYGKDTYVAGSVEVNIGESTTSGDAIIFGDVYGGGALGHVNGTKNESTTEGALLITPTADATTTVNLNKGTIYGDAYGGGLGDANNAAFVGGTVNVNQNEVAYIIDHYTDDNTTTDYDESTIVKSGRIFGCNNLNGYPLGNVNVTVNKTVAGNISKSTDKTSTTAAHTYELAAVYGGGNLAPYKANDKKAKASVKINGCDDTSIETVYGGGNAAAVPETDVLVWGCYEIGTVFGGGNGKDKYWNGTAWTANPGANVGKTVAEEVIGNGNANTVLQGGYIHEAYGGSNSKGTISGNVTIQKQDGGECAVTVEHIYGAGKDADVEGDLILDLGCCKTRTEEVYGCAKNANVKGNVDVIITSGEFGKVFGGNDQSGAIFGRIKVHIEETGCTPIIIDELYGCGNDAAYSVYGYYQAGTIDGTDKPKYVARTSSTDGTAVTFGLPSATDDHTKPPYADPEVNIVSCTRIGKVFGGGLGSKAIVYGNPTVNINQIYGKAYSTVEGNQVYNAVATSLGSIGVDKNNSSVDCGVFGGGNKAKVEGDTKVNIGNLEYVELVSFPKTDVRGFYTRSESEGNYTYTEVTGDDAVAATENTSYYKKVVGANIMGNVYGGGNKADVTGDTHVIICAKETGTGTDKTWTNVAPLGSVKVSIDKDANSKGGSVYGGGCSADVLGNTNVAMCDGYVFNGIFGGGYAGNVGTFTRSFADADLNVFGHTTHEGCIGKPTACAEGTGKCTVVVNGGQIGPIEVATEGMGMNRSVEDGGPVPEGWVWGAGQGLIEDPAKEPDTHFKSYVGSTDVTIGGTAFVLESIIGGGEFGRVLGDTKVTITGQCQIGVGEGKVDGNNKPIRYNDADFINPSTATPEQINAKAALMPECSHFPYGKVIGGKKEYLPYDPYYDDYKTYADAHNLGPASTASPSDGKTWIGCVFAGGSGYMPYLKKDNSGNPIGYDWCSSAGLVEGGTELIISGGHILTNVYGGNEVTNVKGKCKITMTGGTIGVPRTIDQIIAHPLTCYLFGAGKGDQRPHFNTETNVGEVEINISGGIIYGSVFGGGEDGHVQRDVDLTIEKGADFTIGSTTYTNGPIIGTWGTSYVDGNVFGGGRGFGGDAYTAGNVAGSVDVKIKGGNILGSIYGGGRLGSVGYGLYPPTAGDEYYGAMRPNDTDDDAGNSPVSDFKRGYVDIEISGGTIGNTHEYIIPSADNTPSTLDFDGIATWSDDDWKTWGANNNIPLTEFDHASYRLKHTKGGNVFAGGMGRLYQLDGKTPISSVDWWKLGCVKQTKLTVKGGTIKSNVYGGGELGAVKPYVNGTTVQGGTTEIIIKNENNTQIGTEVQDGDDVTQYTFGSVYGGGYGSTIEYLGTSDDTSTENDNPKFVAGLVHGNTKINMQGGKVLASVYGGGEVASVNGYAEVAVSGGEVGKDKVGTKMFGGPTMGNVYGGGSGHPNIVRCGRILKNTKVTISGTNTGTKIYHNVYGGGAYGTVGDFNYTTGTDGKVNGVNSLKTDGTGKAEVIITGGTIGSDGKNNGMVFGSSRGDINKTGERDDHTAWVYNAFVTIGTQGSETGPAIKGSIYGSGENGHTFNNTDVKIHSGTIGVTDDASYLYRGNVYGGGCGTDKYYSNTSLENHDGNGDTYNPLAGIVYGNTTVTIDGGTVVHNVYGAGAMGSVGKATGGTTTGGKTTINISGGTIGVSGTVGDGNVYGAARGDLDDNTDGLSEVQETEVNIMPNTIEGKSEATIKGSVFGGGEAGIVKGDVAVSVSGGNVLQDVYGGGALADTQTSNWNKTTNTWADGKSSTSNTTIVNVLGGSVRDVYGGGLGRVADATNNISAVEAFVYGDTKVNLNGLETEDYVEDIHKNYVQQIPATSTNVAHYELKTTTSGEAPNTTITYAKGAVVNRVFGGNNLNGTPKGNTTVHVFATQNASTESIKAKNSLHTDLETDDATTTYDVVAVYGGGNEASYIPVYDTTSGATACKTQVIIEGCDYTSIKTVYGGGNAASVPETNVEIKSAYEIENVFGGGNGKDKKSDGSENPGADIGQYNNGTETVVYGTGNANTTLEGGLIHEAYGGSNQKGVLKGSVNQTSNPDASDCELIISKVVGAGKYADIDGDVNMILSCQPEKKIDLLFAGADEANVNGNIYLTITNGNFGKVFGGNNLGGAVKGKIVVNVEETGCQPIKIDELYLGGNEAAYSIYGYYESNEDHPVTGKKILKPRESATDINLPVKHDGTKYASIGEFTNYADPILNIISCTHIGKVFGGGLGEGAKMYANPTVNINQTYGKAYRTVGDAQVYDATATTLGEIGDVYGGGNAAKVIGNTTVNIGTKETVELTSVSDDPNTTDVNENQPTVEGANITGDVYGGGNLADVTGNTFVNICATYDSETKKYVAVAEGTKGVTIGGTVYGGGRGQEDTFLCEKAMIGEDGLGADNPDYPNGNTSVRIGHGTVNGSVYGGGKVGRVEMNTVVEIGFGDGGSGTKSPVIEGNVFGAGAGVKTHGYSALVRGNTYVTIAGNTWVKKSVYGGGEIASVARYNVPKTQAEVDAAIAQGYDAVIDMPYALKNSNSGYCYVTVQGHAEIGPDGMKMYHEGTDAIEDKPDDWGHVFAAGKGVLPDTYNFNNFTEENRKNYPKRMALYDANNYREDDKGKTWEYVDPDDSNNKNIWEYFDTEAKYFTFVQTLGLATQTEATIDGNALVKGSVYGGSENGLVQFDTNVKIKGSCQIGVAEAGKPDCAHWEFKAPYEPYDPYAKYMKPADGKYYYDAEFTKDAAGGAKIATDGHTYYGNVFGGGSGSVPYFNTIEGKSEYISSAGTVKGNTHVTISGGHILTNVYGGCEATNVLGTANVTMTDGTVGVQRTDEQIIALPLTGYIFGGGKGDQRIFFNKETNVNHSIVKIEGGRIYGSVYGGGEDGHVLGNVTMTIGKTGNTGPTIGTQGTSYYDGHVFGGGRGFGGEALTAGNVGGAVTLDILGGSILGNVYGGGRLASVGYGLYLTTETGYGVMRADDEYDGSYPDPSTKDASVFYNKGRGKIFVTVSGGTIGNDVENAEHGGNVFGGSMGRLTKLDGSAFDDPNHWTLLATAKEATVNITDGAIIKRNVYGGGEMGTLTEDTYVNVSGGTIGTAGKDDVEYGNVFGGGKGLETQILAGIVKGNTNVQVSGTSDSPKIYHNVYGGGAYGSVGTFTISDDFRTFTWGTPYNDTGVSNVTISGGTIGTGVAMSSDGTFANGNVFGAGRGIANTFWCEKGIAYKAKVNISNGTVKGNVYGGGEVGRVETEALVTIGEGTGTPVIEGSVFGAGAGVETHGYSALVRGNTTVTVLGDAKVGRSVYGGGQIAAVGKYSLVDQAYLDSHPETELEIGMPYSLVDENLGICNVTVKGNAVIGNCGTGHVYGAGMGLVPRDYTYADNAHRPKRMMSVNPSLYNDTNKDYWEYADAEKKYVWEYFPTRDKYLTFVETLGLATRTIVDIDGSAQVNGSVYGGSESGFVQHNTSVTIQGSSTIGVNGDTDTDGNVFGGGLGIKGNPTAGRVSGNSMVTVKSGTMKGSVFGGGENGIVKCGVNVNVLGGTIAKDVYGGGALANTNTAMWDATNSELYDYVEVNDLIPGSSPVTGYYTAKSADALIKDQNAKASSGVKYYAIYKTTVNLLGGTINDAYGGGLGQKEVKTGETVTTPGIEAIVYGDVNLNLNGLEPADYVESVHASLVNDLTTTDGYYLAKDGCKVTGYVFGCNNVNGTPKGHSKVHVFKTVDSVKDPAVEKDARTTYDVKAVFGGGNAADYVPAASDAKQSTEVIIDGCNQTSIEEVYGGGYGAATPGTNVLIKGSYIINNVFGGGYGAGTDNPGANVGYKTFDNPPTTDEEKATYAYGSGKAVIELIAGKLGKVYGGSNTKGDIREGSFLNADTTGDPEGSTDPDEDPCNALLVENIYGGGKDAPMEGGTEIVLDCMKKDWVSEIYAGAENADVENDVSLTITSGKFGRVYGGNKSGGELHGSITVNIEECDICPTPIIIGELYGGGNLAPYSIYGYYEENGILKPRTKEMYDAMTDDDKAAEGIKQGPHRDPIINIRSFSSIGNVYGGGLGEAAVLIGNPTVNINEAYVERDYADEYDGETRDGVVIPKYETGKIGVIGNVFGGGNAAKVIGNTTVNVGTEIGDYVRVNSIIPGKTGVKSYFVKNADGTFTQASGIAQEGVTYYYLIVGANVQGNIYGGGNAAEVTGNTNVVIGKKATTTTPSTSDSTDGSNP